MTTDPNANVAATAFHLSLLPGPPGGVVGLPGTAVAALAAVLGVGVGLGLWMIMSGLSTGRVAGGVAIRARATRGNRGQAPLDTLSVGPRWLLRVAAALLAGIVAGVLTRWPVAAVTAAALVWLAPGMLTGAGSGRARTRQMAQLEALAAWTESLAATLGAAAGLEQAIVATTRTPPDALAGPLSALGNAVQAGVRLPDALAAFGKDLDDEAGLHGADTVVAALVLVAARGGSSLREPLAQIAQATRDEVSARQQVETGRAQIATDTRLIAGLAGAVIAALVVFNRGFLAPYDGPGGQVVLALVILMAASAFAWLRRLAATQDPPQVILGAGGIAGAGTAR